MYSCNITLKNNPTWVQLKCVDAITILKYLSTKMTYINNKNNRKLTPSEKAHVIVIIHVYMFEFFFSLIDFKHHNAKSKSQARGKWVDTMALSAIVHAMSILSGCEILCYLLIMFRYQVPTLIFFILQYKDNSLLN